jgi:hypothetical protein
MLAGIRCGQGGSEALEVLVKNERGFPARKPLLIAAHWGVRMSPGLRALHHPSSRHTWESKLNHKVAASTPAPSSPYASRDIHNPWLSLWSMACPRRRIPANGP